MLLLYRNLWKWKKSDEKSGRTGVSVEVLQKPCEKNAGEELQDIQRDDVTVSRWRAENEVIYVWIDNGGVSLAIGLII